MIRFNWKCVPDMLFLSGDIGPDKDSERFTGVDFEDEKRDQWTSK